MGKILAPLMWNSMGFKKANLLISLMSSFVLLYVVLIATRGMWFMLFLPLLNRFTNNINYIFIAMSKFDLFHPMIGIKISKVMD